MTLYVNGREVGVACTDIPPAVYGIVDLYGRCVEVAMVNRTQNNRNEEVLGTRGIAGGMSRSGNQEGRSGNQKAASNNSTTYNETGSVQGRSGNQEAVQVSESIRTDAVRTGNPQAKSENQRSGNPDGTRATLGPSLKFHSWCGVNVELSADMGVAKRRQHDKLLAGAAVFTHQPLLQGVWFEVVVSKRAEFWNGSLRMGEWVW